MNLILPITIIFVIVILYLVSVQYQKSATERAMINSRAQEIAAISAIYQTKAQKDIIKAQQQTTAKDWIYGVASVSGAISSIFSGFGLGGDD